jgi:Protein of unknown function (DUF1592)/Protein of unknown function (DUF1588)/Protein of unknown function (DUF1595)/Protein of unknown function (DUF1585)
MSGDAMKPPNQAADCEGWDVAMPKRLIRLSFNQVATSLVPIFGQAFATKIVADNSIKDPTERTFPPLGDTDEGSAYIDSKWQTADGIATAAGNEALTNFAAFTGCGAAPTTDCAQGFVTKLAERAFRHPLDEREKTSLLTVYSEVVAKGGTIQEATQYAVSAIFDSPSFLYRTEFGADAKEGPLTPYELASQLSYFVTDGPPDEALLAAAAQNKLTTAADVGPHVDRMLATPAARLNLQAAVIASLGITKVLNVVIDPAKVPEFNAGVAASMFHETELLINNVLWSGGKVPELVTSRKAFINAQLAPFYGVAAPVTVDADGFGAVDLPEIRAGLLTSLGFLTSRSRPDSQSVVGRGLSINDTILCQQNPAFPDNLADQIKSVVMTQENLSERERADYRAANAPCLGCHPSFDPFGISLENFDSVGRYRTVDDQQRPINAAVTLPASAGGTVSNSAAEMGQALANTGAFAACTATKLLTYALAETGVKGNSCATKAVAEAFKATDQSFSALVRTVALSKTITQRSGG